MPSCEKVELNIQVGKEKIMEFIHNETLAQKAKALQRPLNHETKYPCSIVRIERDESAFQGLRAVRLADVDFPLILGRKESVILDFGEHCVGYLQYSLTHLPESIVDSPAMLKFTFGEFPLEIEQPIEEYKGALGSGWLQNETRHIAITPYDGVLDRRYSFRYLKIERVDSALFPVKLTNVCADCVSAVKLCKAKTFSIPDETLNKIYFTSLKTLKECEQDVFEDGPKRDRRLWIGDLRLQALTDNVTFSNADLVKRCIYLFAAHRAEHGFVSQCVFADSYPYVYEWVFLDYSLFYISCLYDCMNRYDDIEFFNDAYPMAVEQAEKVTALFESGDSRFKSTAFIDWCKDLDKSIAMLGVYIYTLKQLIVLAKKYGKECSRFEEKVEEATKALLAYYSKEKGLFVTESGQISWHSQIWAVLAGVFSREENVKLLQTVKSANPEFYIHTPYMMHYYLEALYTNGEKEEVISIIRQYWGRMIEYGFDCCLEVFDPNNHWDSPYHDAVLNSACHAWSCTPAYWIYRYYHE